MTREEACNRIDAIIARHEIDDDYITITSLLDYDALRMARKALEQKPCEDAISRQAAIDAMREDTCGCCWDAKDILKQLPSVSAEKTGHWIEVIDEIDSLGNKTWHHKCSICGNEDSGWGNYKYCPNCGARMESEVRDENDK